MLRRTVLLPDGPPVLGSPRLIRRSGQIVRWNATKIEAAIRSAFLSLGADPTPAEAVADRVDERAHALGVAYVPIEIVQDLVQEELVLAGHMRGGRALHPLPRRAGRPARARHRRGRGGG